MDEPTCRTCYAHSLPDDERLRFLTAPVTGCVHYCPEHQAVVDKLHSFSLEFIKTNPIAAARFPLAGELKEER